MTEIMSTADLKSLLENKIRSLTVSKSHCYFRIESVRIKCLHKILVKEDPDHDVLKLAMIKVEMAAVIDVTKPL